MVYDMFRVHSDIKQECDNNANIHLYKYMYAYACKVNVGYFNQLFKDMSYIL